MAENFGAHATKLLSSLGITPSSIRRKQSFFTGSGTDYHTKNCEFYKVCYSKQNPIYKDSVEVTTSLWEIYKNNKTVTLCSCLAELVMQNGGHLPKGICKRSDNFALVILLIVVQSLETLEKTRNKNFHLAPGLCMSAIIQSNSIITGIITHYSRTYLKNGVHPYEIKAWQAIKAYEQIPNSLAYTNSQALQASCKEYRKNTKYKAVLLNALNIKNQTDYVLAVLLDAKELNFISSHNKFSEEAWQVSKDKGLLMLESVYSFAVNTEVHCDDYLLYAPLELMLLLEKRYHVIKSSTQKDRLDKADIQLVDTLINWSYPSSLTSKKLDDLLHVAWCLQ